MDTFVADLRHARRGLRRYPGFTSVTLLSLAVGIGALTTAFAVVDAVEFRPLPFASPERLLSLGETKGATGSSCGTCRSSWRAAETWQREMRTLSATAVLEPSGARWYERDRAERLLTADVTASFFAVLGVRPLLGRTFTTEEAGPTAARVVVVGYDFWQTRLGGDPAIVGRALDLNAAHGRGPYTVIGVMPREFRFLDNQAWIPLASPKDDAADRRYAVVGRLASGRSMTDATTESRVLHSRLASELPQAYGEWTSVVLPFRDWVLQSRVDAGRGRFLLFGVTAFVLLLATANVASLSVARARTRAFEASVRSALGATRGRLVRQFLTETLALALLGGSLGVGFAMYGIDAAGE